MTANIAVEQTAGSPVLRLVTAGVRCTVDALPRCRDSRSSAIARTAYREMMARNECIRVLSEL
jgi:hypothetical protein